MRSLLLLLLVAGVLFALVLRDLTAEKSADVTGPFGQAIPGLSSIELAQFEFGQSVFNRRFTREEGLGPHFNATSCASCHENPAPGGSSERYRDFFLAARVAKGGAIEKLYPDCTQDNIETHDSDLCLPSIVMPHYGPKGTIADPIAPEVEHPRIPGDVDLVARRNTPPLFGIGLFRLVSDEEILSRSDATDEDGDGISGRSNLITTENLAVGRFGYKCQTGSIEAFNRGALHNQMGITSDSTELVASAHRDLFQKLLAPKVAHAQVATPRDRITDFDDESDPEISRGEMLALVFFQESLAAPRRGRITPAVQEGEATFERIGCTKCHVPSLPTPLGMIHPYTDLLLHNMGPELADGIKMHVAQGDEFRTQPLWGLCEHGPFLHDGRADTVSEAIEAHGGEATAARDEYSNLTDKERQDLHRFLESL